MFWKPDLSRRRTRGLALTEMLIAVALVLVTASLVILQFNRARGGGEDSRRDDDVRMLNTAITSYLENGGSIPADITGDLILTKMKKAAAETVAGTFAGLKGPFIDVRLKGVTVDPNTVSPRIVWNAAKARFSVSDRGTGWSGVEYNAAAGAVDYGTETRQNTNSFASRDPWVWDYADLGASRRSRSRAPSTDSTVTPSTPSPDALQLKAPVINPTSGVFAHSAFPLSLAITDRNVAGTSDLLYQINGGPWQVWQGGPLALDKALRTTVTAYSKAREMNDWTDSASVTETYTTYFLRGQATGTLVSPAGDAQFLYTLASGGTSLTWGKLESAGQSVSSVQVMPSATSTFEAGEGESIDLGSLRYYNGVTRAGTNARSATFRLNVNLSVPSGSTASVDIPVRMLNTIHYPWTPEADKVDYFWVPKNTTLSQPITVLDRRFNLQIVAQAASSTMDGTDLKIPVSENATSSVSLTATIVAVP